MQRHEPTAWEGNEPLVGWAAPSGEWLRQALEEAEQRVADLRAQVQQRRIEEAQARMRTQEGEPGGKLYLAIGKSIREARGRAGLTQQVLGEAVGILRTSIVNIEKGRQRLPIDLLYDIADVLGVEAISLLPKNEDV